MKHVVIGILTRERSTGEVEYLLVQSRKDFGEFTGCWYPPGGHVETGETEEEALKREIAEELGLEIRPLYKIAETPGDVPEQITHWWACKPLSDALHVDEEELVAAKFCTFAEMQDLRLWPATRKFFDDFQLVRLSY